MRTFISLLCASVLLFSCEPQKKEPQKKEINQVEKSEVIKNPTNKVLLSKDIVWKKLNPARGDKSPLAGTIFGNLKDSVYTGFLAKFVNGFSSPPHIHNVTYRAVVIKGLILNDEANAENIWMPPGSFWTQPAGQVHITAAKGNENIAYVEITRGPYLVKKIDEAFDSEEKPINIDASNVVWLNNSETSWIDKGCQAELSFLLNRKQTGHTKSLFIQLPKNFDGKIITEGTLLKAVVIQGNLQYEVPQSKKWKMLDPSSAFSATGKAIHQIKTNGHTKTILYIRTNAPLKIMSK